MAYVSVAGIQIVRVADPGDISKERVLLRMEQSVDLVNYILLNAYSEENEVYDLNQHIFWFPSVVATQGEYVRLYTKSGNYTLTEGLFGGSRARFHNFYWGKKAAVWRASPIPGLPMFSNTAVVIRISNWIHKKVP